MPTLIRCIEGEIVPKGKAYLILEAYESADFLSALDGVIARMQHLGAQEIFLASKTEAFSLSGQEMEIAGHRFAFETDFWLLQKQLSKQANPISYTLKIKKLANWNLELFLALYNASFFSLPNSKTYEREDGETLLQDANRQAGFFMQGGVPIGIFELVQDEDLFEIAGIAILEEYRGRGFGKFALNLLEERIWDAGGKGARILCAGSNNRAMALYEHSGYKKYQLLSSWYRYCPMNET